jgi:aspartyl-tRNA synthetase
MKIQNVETTKKIGEEVELAGWVHARRDHGKIIFIDLRDRTGLIQVVLSEDLYEKAKHLGPEYVVRIKGLVKERPEGMKNEKIPTGSVEIEAKELEILAKAKVPPFDPTTDTKKINEDKRMEYRYIDLRSTRMQKNIKMRHEFTQFVRNYLSEKGFLEIETPDITKATPEGARDYLVPARLHPGRFYALPQSPQQFKQLLMVAGIEKYFQLARCFRDEDPRGDRQPEHTQIDIEMSFVEQNDILELFESLIIELIKKLYPQKKISQIPFSRLKYDEVIKKYKTDRPDLRKDKNDQDELAFAWILNWPYFSWDKEENRWDPHHHIFTAPRVKDVQELEKDPKNARSWQHDLVLNGNEIAGGSLRITDPKVQEKVLELVGISAEEVKEKFGHMLRAFEYGVPPHGGIASGIDRLCMILQNEKNIREVIAFPKTGDGRDLMMDAPSEVDQKQLDELGIKIIKPQ